MKKICTHVAVFAGLMGGFPAISSAAPVTTVLAITSDNKPEDFRKTGKDDSSGVKPDLSDYAPMIAIGLLVAFSLVLYRIPDKPESDPEPEKPAEA